MATATELLRAAEHMQQLAAGLYQQNMHHTPRMIGDVVSIMRDEARRLQVDGSMATKGAVSALRERWQGPEPGRSWPEGWPPFAVLRRAFYAMGVSHRPSTVSVERRAHGPSESDFARRKAAKNRRHAWARAVKIEMLETITISEVAR